MSLVLGNSKKCSYVYTAWLLIVLKDKKSAETTALSRESQKNVIREEASQQGFDINNVEVRKGEDYSCKASPFGN